MEMRVIRQNDPDDAIRDPDVIRTSVVAWRDGISASLAAHLKVPLDWDEGSGSPYFTDKPTWDCYSDLLLWAAYQEQPELIRPEGHVDDWSTDPAYRLSTHADAVSSYTHLWDVSLWLPGAFDFVFQAQDLGGEEVWVGSSHALLGQLQTLNARTWQADSATQGQWLRRGAECGAPLEIGARFAFALMLQLTTKAVDHRLPMRMDW